MTPAPTCAKWHVVLQSFPRQSLCLTKFSYAGLFQHGFLSLLLDLFVKYPFNNLLHNIVLRAILFVLKSDTDALVNHLLSDCNVASWLVGAPEEVDSLQGEPMLLSSCRLPLENSQKLPAPLFVVPHARQVLRKVVPRTLLDQGLEGISGDFEGHGCSISQHRLYWLGSNAK